MAITFGKLESIITVPATTTITATDSVGSYTCTLDAGTYYMSSAGSGANDLLAQLAADLTADGSGGDAWAVTIAAGENGTGLVTIANPDADGVWDIDWTLSTNGTSLRDVLGFAGNITNGAGSGEIGTKQAKFLWLPDGPISTPFGTRVKAYESDLRQVVSAAGHVSSAKSQRRGFFSADWRVTRSKAHVTAENRANESWEQFYIDALLGEHAFGIPGPSLRLYPDAATDATYDTVKLMGELAKNFAPTPVREGFVGIYDIELDRLMEVPS